jgi:hypothetical protein
MNLTIVAEKAADDLKAFIQEREDEIRKAIISASESAAENDQPCKFKMSLGIILDLDKSTQENVLAWGMRFKLSATSQIEDPLQMKLESVVNN